MYLLICENDAYGEFYVGPFRSFERAEKALDRMMAVGTDGCIRDLEGWRAQAGWLRQAEEDGG